jgi:hypothetical protein
MEEEEDIAMVLALHANKQPKHGGSSIGRELCDELCICG